MKAHVLRFNLGDTQLFQLTDNTPPEDGSMIVYSGVMYFVVDVKYTITNQYAAIYADVALREC